MPFDGPGEALATVRCLFSDDDPVRDLMSLPEAFVVVAPDTPAARAESANERPPFPRNCINGLT